MKARFAVLTAVLAGAVAVASGADPQLLNMVMDDAKVMAGVNIEQAKTTPFGQYVLSQLPAQDKHLDEVITLTGFDPRRDVRELLLASPSSDSKSGIALARGIFDIAKI